MITEIAIAQAVAEGTLPSPTPWMNATYVALRLSGTGVAWRASVGEFTYRDPAIWSSAVMLRRFLGLPIVVSHPDTGTLTSRSYGNTVVGSVIWTFVDQAEDAPWGIGRILDKGAAQGIVEGVFCTSPGVVIDPAQCAVTEVDGKRLLVEGEPTLLDHIALIDMSEGNKGVWQRDDGPGVKTDNIKTDWSAAYDYA